MSLRSANRLASDPPPVACAPPVATLTRVVVSCASTSVPEQTTIASGAIPHAQYFGSHIVVIASPFGHAAPHLLISGMLTAARSLSARSLMQTREPI